MKKAALIGFVLALALSAGLIMLAEDITQQVTARPIERPH